MTSHQGPSGHTVHKRPDDVEPGFCVEDIMALRPCWTRQQVRAAFGSSATVTAAEIAGSDVPFDDARWVLIRLLSVSLRSEFAHWCAAHAAKSAAKSAKSAKSAESAKSAAKSAKSAESAKSAAKSAKSAAKFAEYAEYAAEYAGYAAEYAAEYAEKQCAKLVSLLDLLCILH